jgi:copper chaperone CopZ
MRSTQLGLIGAGLLVLTGASVFAQDEKEVQVNTTLARVVEVKISVPSIRCSNCAKTVSKAVSSRSGVKHVTVDTKQKIALVKYDEKMLELSDLEMAISKAGYDANDIKRDPNAYKELDECCK